MAVTAGRAEQTSIADIWMTVTPSAESSHLTGQPHPCSPPCPSIACSQPAHHHCLSRGYHTARLVCPPALQKAIDAGTAAALLVLPRPVAETTKSVEGVRLFANMLKGLAVSCNAICQPADSQNASVQKWQTSCDKSSESATRLLSLKNQRNSHWDHACAHLFLILELSFLV